MKNSHENCELPYLFILSVSFLLGAQKGTHVEKLCWFAFFIALLKRAAVHIQFFQACFMKCSPLFTKQAFMNKTCRLFLERVMRESGT
jgi:hypothetical protein